MPGSTPSRRRKRVVSRPPRHGNAVRFAISLDPELAGRLDGWVGKRNSASRSEALRFLIRRELLDPPEAPDPNSDALGVVTVMYRHDLPHVLRRVTAAQHRWGEHIRASTHIHLEGGACAEVLVLMGKRREVEQAAEDIRGVKGLNDGRYLITSPRVAGGRTGHRHPHNT